MGHFSVHPEQMRAHARGLDEVVDNLEEAQQAATHATISGTTAYGILCSPILLPMMATVEGLSHAAIETANTAVATTGEAITACADTYDALDAEAKTSFEKILNEMAEKLGWQGQ